MPNRPVIKPPLGQAQERFDIKKGLSRKKVSHQNEPSTWWNVCNFRFYKQNIFSFLRKSLYSTVAPTEQTLTVPNNSCLVNLHIGIRPPVVSDGSITVIVGDSLS